MGLDLDPSEIMGGPIIQLYIMLLLTNRWRTYDRRYSNPILGIMTYLVGILLYLVNDIICTLSYRQ